MTDLIVLAALVGFLVGFFLLTAYETRHAVRFFAAPRGRLDAYTERAFFIWNHVDFAAFIREEIQRFFKRVGHDVVHRTLQAVRMAERLLTRIVRRLRMKEYVHQKPQDSNRPFLESLSTFKEQLVATRSGREREIHETL